MSEYDQPMAASGESDVANPDSPSTHKKASIFGKLKDKTRKAGSRIKSKVGKKKNPDGTESPSVDGEEAEEEEESTSDDSPSPASPASPVTSVPRDMGTTFQSEPSRFGSDNGAAKEESEPAPDMSGLSLDDPATKDGSEPSVTEKPREPSDGYKYALDGGDWGLVPVASREPESEEEPVTEKASEATGGVGAKTEEIGDRRHDAATDVKDAVADKGSEVPEQTEDGPYFTDAAESKKYESKDATESKSMEAEAAAESKAYETKDAVESKAEDLNNATDDSETYSQKAGNAAADAKDTVAGPLGMNEKSSEGPSTVEKVKETLGMDKPSEGPSVVDQAKQALGSALDTTKDQTARTEGDASAATETAKESTGSALDTTKDHATQAEETVADAATPKQEDKALSDKITETLAGLPAKASDTAASVTATAKSPTTTTPGTLTDAPAAHSSEPSPGILGKIGGLFGYGAKSPEVHSPDATH